MPLNLDDAIRAGDVEIQHRIRRYDVKWGRPHFAVTYKRLLLAKMPIFYWSMENSDYGGGSLYSRNWGSKGRDYDLRYVGYSGFEFALGQADPTDNEVNFKSVGYGESTVACSNSDLTYGYSIVLWLKPNVVLENGHIDGLISKQTSYGVGTGGVCSIHIEGNAGSNRLAFWFNNGEVVYTDPLDVIFEVGQRYCITLTVEPSGPLTDPDKPLSKDNPRTWIDTNEMHIYVNGVEVYTGSTVNNKPDLTTNNCKWLVGAARQAGTPVWFFDGWMDEVGVFPTAFNEFTAQQIFAVGQSATYLEPDEDFDNDVVGSYADQKRYKDLVKSHSPTHYWPLDTILSGAGNYYKYVADETAAGLYSTPLSIARNAGQWNSNHIITSPINAMNYTTADPPGKALIISGDNYPAIAYGRNPGSNLIWDRLSTDVREMTAECWFKKNNANNSHWDGIMGLDEYFSTKGFVMGVQNSGYRIGVWWSFVVNNSRQTKSLQYNGPMDNDLWYHLAITLNRNGEARMYVNGVLVASASWGRTYAYQSPRLANFIVGGNGTDPFNTSPTGQFDEIATYSRALSAAEIYAHYWTGALGPFAKVTLNGGDPLQDPSPFVIGTNEYSELINEEDITEYVENYSFDDDLKQLIPTASMTVRDDWGEQNINSKLGANTYVKIERRFRSPSLDYDSGWVSLRHFLCEGPIGGSMSTSGQRVYTVALKGVTKLLNLDLAHTPIEPDKVLVRKRKLDVNSATTEYTKFHMSRDPNNPVLENVFINWAEFPSVKLWVTDFLNLDDTDNNKGGLSDPKEILRIKGSEGAVRILGGEGAVVIDNTYLLDKVGDNGLGNPSTIMAEFYRYVTSEDKVVTTVASMSVVRDRWRVSLANNLVLVDGMAFLVKSGTAKGKYWRLVSTGSDVNFSNITKIVAGTNLTNVAGSGSYDWTKVSSFNNATPPPGGGTQYAIQALGPNSYNAEYTFKYADVPMAVTLPPSSADWADGSVITGIRITMWRRMRTNYGSFANPQNFTDLGTHLRIGSLTTTDAKKSGSYSTNANWEAVVFGGDKQALGVNWTWGQIKNSMNDVSIRHKVKIGSRYNYSNGLRNIVEVYQFKIEVFVEDLGVVTLQDIHGYPVHPEYEGLAIGDVVQVGDFNAVEDAVRKALYRCNFQENNSTKPFYFELDDCPSTLAPSVPPIRPQISDQTYWAEMVEDLLKYAPPNYRLFADEEGVTRARLSGFLIGATPIHVLEGRIDINEDRGDYGIATRLIVEGESSDSFNIALNVDAGGTSACRAYVLDGYADPNEQPDSDDSMGVSKTQLEADAIWKQVFNGNPKTPVPSTANNWKTRYGVILAEEGPASQVKRWHYEDTPLCAIDIGRSTTGTPIEIEALQFTWMNHYLEGNAIAQSMIVHYMTEADYEAEFGASLDAVPNQEDNTYFPPSTSRAWRLLIDEFALQEGDTTIEANDFESGRPTQVRFLMFTVGQGHYRFPVLEVEGGDRDAAIRVTMAEIKVWTSRRIIATAELGVSGIFGTGDYKELATRLRRRTDYLEKNLYLNDFDKAKQFALAELQERYVDFSPIAVTVFAPTVMVGDVIYLVHPETRVGKAYLVVAASHDATGVGRFQILNYDINQ